MMHRNHRVAAVLVRSFALGEITRRAAGAIPRVTLAIRRVTTDLESTWCSDGNCNERGKGNKSSEAGEHVYQVSKLVGSRGLEELFAEDNWNSFLPFYTASSTSHIVYVVYFLCKHWWSKTGRGLMMS